MGNQYRNYHPSKDSSDGWAEKADDFSGPILQVEEGQCLCGCGQTPQGKNSLFMMGHDARYRGILLRAHVAGVPVSLTMSADETPYAWDAIKLAESHGWEHYLTAAKLREDDRAKAKTKKANEALLAKATGPQIGDTKVIKVGRWEKTGQVVAIFDDGATIEYAYVTSKGETKTHRVSK